MSMFQEKLTQFEAKKAEIAALDKEVAPKIEALQKEFQEKVESLKTEYNGLVNEAKRELDNASARYRAELKAWAGITEGETVEVLSVLKAMRKVAEME